MPVQRQDRKIKLFICITLYNEDQDTLRKTLMGVADVRRGAAGGGARGPSAGTALLLHSMVFTHAERSFSGLFFSPAHLLPAPTLPAEPGGGVPAVPAEGRAARAGLDRGGGVPHPGRHQQRARVGAGRLDRAGGRGAEGFLQGWLGCYGAARSLPAWPSPYHTYTLTGQHCLPLAQGFFSPVVLQDEVLATPVSLHLFEYTARWVAWAQGMRERISGGTGAVPEFEKR